ncbi:MBL fold metallo-hydrolase [Mucilaginibacter sp.]|jgi:glyoxylase-like metal-dependent hydrolase (beta-lactamase superfamily II)/rhodanese-related sulfurtransferase|uniref:MBL fold metallo-hydrolase n=1 Tax=Mucilaginibacter sp. TaxID=1882438 RepID=UPI002C63ED00|nr:MBL fold metallo-hydrolase [Mucilaginibacter sp.]HTI57894.1 MBL fold metallo-hydrolase [Mucilaginibacter sp.]
MIIHQFYDKGLAHASYAVIRLGKMIVIDPARDPQPYYDFATFNDAEIIGVIETHPHADFISSHLEIHQTTGATIYASKLLGAEYPHETFDDGDIIHLADIKLKALNTPGHSPDSICILVVDENGNDKAIFTGDTLFVGDVGRPDLRENAGNITAAKEVLARQMYHSTREKLMTLPHHVIVYPAHGPGSLCGKNISPDLESTIGHELRENYALKFMKESTFVDILVSDQPFMPKYFGHDVEINKKGAEPLDKSVSAVPRIDKNSALEKGIVIVDTRPVDNFRTSHLHGAMNIQDGDKFETWLGSIIGPDEPFYLIGTDETSLDTLIRKAAKIGYEKNIKAALLPPDQMPEVLPEIDRSDYKFHPDHYSIVDVRNWGEVNENKIFPHSISIPLPELRERLGDIPTDKPIVVHCAAGYRSAAATSIIAGKINSVPVYDLGEAVVEVVRRKAKV